MAKKNDKGLTWVEGKGYEGVVYSYTNTADDDKMYIGETPRESTRRDSWNNPGNAYAGRKIAQARKEYGLEPWEYQVLERHYSDSLEDLENILVEREIFFINLYDTMRNGYNANLGGSGHRGGQTDESRKRISQNHRSYQSEETKMLLSAAMRGHDVKEITRKKISTGNSGKVRTEEVKQAQSERMKGQVPMAAKEGADRWREANGGGFWKGKTMSEEAKSKMKKAQQDRGTAVIAHFPDGLTQEFNTLLDAEKATGVKAGSIYNNLKHSNEKFKTKRGFWFERKEVGHV